MLAESHGTSSSSSVVAAPESWVDGLEQERKFWDWWFENKGGEWPGDFEFRMDPNSQLGRNVTRWLDERATQHHILDVGAGPLTVLPKKWQGHEVRITAVDPLADIYDSIMDKRDVTPPVRTTWCHGELLAHRFPRNHFDLVWAQNCVDHSYAPLAVIANMLAVVKVGKHVVMRHNPNEAEHEKYKGLHQWNFDVKNGRFVVWNRAREIDLAKHLHGLAVVEAWTESDGPVCVSLQKRHNPTTRAKPRLLAAVNRVLRRGGFELRHNYSKWNIGGDVVATAQLHH